MDTNEKVTDPVPRRMVYKAVKNFIVNDCGLSKSYIEGLIGNRVLLFTKQIVAEYMHTNAFGRQLKQVIEEQVAAYIKQRIAVDVRKMTFDVTVTEKPDA